MYPLTFKQLGLLVLLLGSLLASTSSYLENSRSVWVAAHDLPAYHSIEVYDIKTIEVKTGSLPEGFIPGANSILGNYTLVNISEGWVVSEDQIKKIPQDLNLREKVVTGIMATPAMVLGGKLMRGDTVNLLLAKAQERTVLEIDNLYILGVEKLAGNSSCESSSSCYSFVVVMAVPVDRIKELSNANLKDRVQIVKRAG
jgi:Flp pilus assembly protein CpaB